MHRSRFAADILRGGYFFWFQAIIEGKKSQYSFSLLGKLLFLYFLNGTLDIKRWTLDT